MAKQKAPEKKVLKRKANSKEEVEVTPDATKARGPRGPYKKKKAEETPEESSAAEASLAASEATDTSEAIESIEAKEDIGAEETTEAKVTVQGVSGRSMGIR